MAIKGGMGIKVRSVGLNLPITGHGGELPPQVRKQILKIMALKAMNIIWDRVKRGEDLSGARFKPYTDAYYKWKAKKGRAPETEGDWLTLSGQMLGSLTPLFVGSDMWVVGFAGARVEGASNALIAAVNHEKYGRLFMGLTENEKTDLVKNTITEATAQGLLDALKPKRKGSRR